MRFQAIFVAGFVILSVIVRRQLFLRMDDNYFSGSATTITPHRRQLLLDPARGVERRLPLQMCSRLVPPKTP
jgi:hypothetical protein